MNHSLAAPAPKVEAATAEALRESEGCTAAPAEEVEAATAQPLVALDDDVAVDAVTPSESVLGAVEHVEAVEKATAEEIRSSSIEAATAEAIICIEPAPIAQRPIVDLQQRQHSPEKSDTKSNTIRVEDLRPTDFEGKAAVPHEIVQTTNSWYRKLIPSFLRSDHRRLVPFGELVRYVVIKNDYIFIYVEQTDPSPLYTFPLTDNFMVVYEDTTNPHPNAIAITNPGGNNNNHQYKTILILDKKNDNNNNKLLYQFTFDTFDDKSKSKLFYDAVTAKTTTTTVPGVAAVVGNSDLHKKKNEKSDTKK